VSVVRKILIALDAESEAQVALQTGFALGSRLHAEVSVCCVCPDIGLQAEMLADVVSESELKTYLRGREIERTRLLMKPHTDDPDKVQIQVVFGIPFIEIIRHALSVNADLIVQSSVPDSGGRGVFTSSDWHLMRKSPVPVWIAKGEHAEPTNIAVAIDVLSEEAGSEVFNRQLLGLATTIADAFAVPLNVYSAWHLPGESALRDSPFLRVEEKKISDLLQRRLDETTTAQSTLADWIQTHRSTNAAPIRWHIEKASPRVGIAEFIEGHKIDLVIMGTVGRVGIPGFLIGNTAETVLSRIRCSALTLKPNSFVSPVS